MDTNSNRLTQEILEWPLQLKLTNKNGVLMEINAWYLILSQILRAEPPFSLPISLEESILTATVTIGEVQYQWEVPKPKEFI